MTLLISCIPYLSDWTYWMMPTPAPLHSLPSIYRSAEAISPTYPYSRSLGKVEEEKALNESAVHNIVTTERTHDYEPDPGLE